MASCIRNARTSKYLPKELADQKEAYENEHFHYDSNNDTLDCKLLRANPYQIFFEDVYPEETREDELTGEMINVLRSYTDSRTHECYMKTNLNLLSGNFDQIDWTYVNQLRSTIRALKQTNIKPIYYRGLVLSDREIQYYLDQRGRCYYTNSFLSFTTDRLLIYPGNALLILRTDQSSEKAKQNIANIWKWSTFSDEKEALVAVGTKLRILSVHQRGGKWEIEVELTEEQCDNISSSSPLIESI